MKGNNTMNENQSKLDNLIANAFPVIYLGGWLLIVLAIIFN